MTRLFAHVRQDLPASLVVFLVATPLCLGIALASGAPLFSGLLSGIIGGIVVGFLSDSRLSVSGPAAGLTAVVLAAISSLGSFEVFLLAVVLAGAMQLVLGLLRAGLIANYFPSNVIKGMLAAIGLIIILKQIPHAFGYDADTEGDLAFLQPDGESSFSALLKPLAHVDVGATLIAGTCLALLMLWERPFMRRFKLIPGPLVAVIVGVVMNELFAYSSWDDLVLTGDHLVRVPLVGSWDEFTALLRFPDFSQLGNKDVWIVALTLAAVASIETLLSIEAVDKLDPHKHITSPNRELFAQGAGNIVAGLVGGLPVTSVIVRSSANVAAGARSKLSTIAHGVLLLGCVLLIPTLLNKIPLASLAAVLLMVGYKLAKPALFTQMWRQGKYQAIPFLITVVAIVFTDLLTGIAIGLGASIFGILRGNMMNGYSFHQAEFHTGDIVKIELAEEVTFLNKASILLTLEGIPGGATVNIDASKTKYIDHDVLEIIREFADVRAGERGIKSVLIGFKAEYALRNTDHVRMGTLNRNTRDRLTPAGVLQALREGNVRFVANLRLDRDLLQQVSETRESQHPMAVILSCIDSRTSSELVFDLGLGDVFSVRVAGNVLNDDVLGSMEFACKVAGAKVVVVLGHSECGAIKGACTGAKLGHLSALLQRIEPAVRTIVPAPHARFEKQPLVYEAVAHNNAVLVARDIPKRSPLLAQMIEAREIVLVAGMYDVHTGRAELFEAPQLLPPVDAAAAESASLPLTPTSEGQPA